jgi:hypothetical protein
MLALLLSYYYWPKLTSDVARYVVRCLFARDQRKPSQMLVYISHYQCLIPIAHHHHEFCIGVTLRVKDHGFYSCGCRPIFQDDPSSTLLEDDGCHLDCSPLFSGNCPYA